MARHGRVATSITQPPAGQTGPAPVARNIEADGDSGPITRAAVLASALEIIDRDGVDKLSMRRLGEAVGRDPDGSLSPCAQQGCGARRGRRDGLRTASAGHHNAEIGPPHCASSATSSAIWRARIPMWCRC